MQKSGKENIKKFIEDNYLHMSDCQIGQYFGFLPNSIQRIRIQMGFIKESDSERLVDRVHNNTLCWNCKNAVPNTLYGCSWSRKFIPIDGWTAKKRCLSGIGESWHVYRCPKFIKENLAEGGEEI